jgi:tRNA threonylcarbamoyl adenosine modification protein (Sua5/YciO/YrdC/YwlC family)
MTQLFNIHSVNPQLRLIRRVVEVLQDNGVIVYPTDSAYALGCHLDSKEAAERIRNIRQLDKNHNFTLLCKDLSELANFAHVDNPVFRLLKAYTPGPYTFILPATSEVPRRLVHPKRKTIGLRVPDHPIAHALLESLGGPIMSVTLIMPGDDTPLADPEEIYNRLKGQVELIIDGGSCGVSPTTVIDLTEGVPILVRKGKGKGETPFE